MGQGYATAQTDRASCMAARQPILYAVPEFRIAVRDRSRHKREQAGFCLDLAPQEYSIPRQLSDIQQLHSSMANAFGPCCGSVLSHGPRKNAVSDFSGLGMPRVARAARPVSLQPSLQSSDPDDCQMFVSLGCAAENLEQTPLSHVSIPCEHATARNRLLITHYFATSAIPGAVRSAS